MSKPQNPYAAYLDMPGTAAPSRSVGSLAPMTFLENLCVDEESNLTVTSLLDGRIWRLPFGGAPELVTQIAGRPSGIEAAPTTGWICNGWTDQGVVAIFHVLPDGRWKTLLEVPQAAFPNGIQRIPGDHYLFNDSVLPTIWDFDFHDRTVTPWLADSRFAPKPGSWEPALNGMKIWKDELYFSNASKAELWKVGIRNGKPTGKPHLVKSDVHIDDFAFDVEGNLYMTTHPLDVVLKLTPDGKLTKIAGPEEGVRGCPACRFGRRSGDETGLYVIADGGLFNPLSGGLQPAQVVRLEIGIRGSEVY